MIEVDPGDPAFADPTKPIGPVYDRGGGASARGARRAGRSSPTATACGASSRRRAPKRIFGIRPDRWLLEHGCVVICTGGGGIPIDVHRRAGAAGQRLVGVEAVIDKDLASALLAEDLDADVLVDRDRRRRRVRGLGHAAAARDPPHHARRARGARVRRGLDGPQGARRLLVRRADRRLAAIGSIDDTQALLRGEAGTRVALDAVRTSTRLEGTEMATTERQRPDGRRAAARGTCSAREDVARPPRRRAGARPDGRRGRRAARSFGPNKFAEAQDGAALARVRAPVPRPDADRPARRRHRSRSTRSSSSAPGS